MKGQRSEDIYNKFQKDYIRRSLKKDAESFTIKIRSYQVKTEDKNRGIIQVPENIPDYIDLFNLEKKDKKELIIWMNNRGRIFLW